MRIMTLCLLLILFPFAHGATLTDVSRLAQKNYVTKALGVLSKIERTKKVPQDLVNLTRARLYFQRGNLKAAIATYQKIPKASEYWFEAVEERAHAEGRLGNYHKAIAGLETVFAEPFQDLTGPEPYFIAAMTYLKICDYEGVLKTTRRFKKRFTPRLNMLKKLAEGGSNEGIEALRGKILNFETAAKQARKIPRNLHRFSHPMKNLSRLAKAELEEIQQVVTKLQIVEAEVVHRVHLATNNGNRPVIGNKPEGNDILVFPKNDDEVWIDEIGNYSAVVEKCPEPTRRVSL